MISLQLSKYFIPCFLLLSILPCYNSIVYKDESKLFSFNNPLSLGVFSPAGRKRLVLFLDDLNMPAADRFGTQPPLELFRQLLDSGAVYTFGSGAVPTIECSRVLDTTLISALTPRGAGMTIDPFKKC
jgi:hypothetical protein